MSDFQWRRAGKAHKFGHDMLTDGAVMPFKYAMERVTDPAILVPHLFEESDPDFAKRVSPGDIVIAGRNFCKGKAHVPGFIAMKALGLGVLCESMPFLSYRAAISSGVTLLAECEGVNGLADTGDEIEVDFLTGDFANRTKGTKRKFPPVPEGLRELLQHGGTSGMLKHWWETVGRHEAQAASA